jgi:alpha,alpha-trehalase
LLAQEDTDGDRKITILDHTTPFELRDDAGVTVRVEAGEYPLSVLMQELKRAENSFH